MISWRKHEFYTGRLYWNTGLLGYIKLSQNTKSDRKESATLTIHPCMYIHIRFEKYSKYVKFLKIYANFCWVKSSPIGQNSNRLPSIGQDPIG